MHSLWPGRECAYPRTNFVVLVILVVSISSRMTRGSLMFMEMAIVVVLAAVGRPMSAHPKAEIYRKLV